MIIQLIIICIYFIVTIALGLIKSRGKKDTDKYHGVGLSVASIVFASAGEWLGGTATTGVGEYGFLFGISGAWYTIANAIGVMFLALFFAKMYRNIGEVTIPGIIGRTFGNAARKVSGIFLVIVMIAVGMSQMIAAGKFAQSMFGIDFKLAVIVFTIILIIYTLAGGMRAISSTNALHLFVMYIGIVITLIVSIHMIGGTKSFTDGIKMMEEVDGGNYLSMTKIGFPKISSWLIASLLGACTAQAGIQPVLASKDVPTAKKACIWTAIVVAPFGIITALIGVAAKVMSSQGQLLDVNGNLVTDGKIAINAVMMNMPTALGGIALAAILAAIMSTASPIMLASGTMIIKDLLPAKMLDGKSDKDTLCISRISTAISGLICCVGAIVLVNQSSVLDIVYSAYSLRGALFIIMIYGFFWKKASSKGACISMVLTGFFAILWAAYKLLFGHYPIFDWLTETYVAVFVAAISMVFLSILFPNNKEGYTCQTES